MSTGVERLYSHFIYTCWHKTTHTHTHTLTEAQSKSDGDGNEGLRLQCRWCGVTFNHRKTCIGLDSPQQSLPPLQPATYFCFIRWAERMTLQRERASLSLTLFLSCTKKSRVERRRRDLRPLTYSDGVSSPHQSRMAANPLLCFYRKKKKKGAERDGGRRERQKDVTECICI